MLPQANTASSVLRTSSMRSTQLERTSSPPTTSCGPSSCHHLVVAWTRRPHTLWREAMLATGKTRSTEWSGGWTELMVSRGQTVGYQKASQSLRRGLWCIFFFPHLIDCGENTTDFKPIMSETTSSFRCHLWPALFCAMSRQNKSWFWRAGIIWSCFSH